MKRRPSHSGPKPRAAGKSWWKSPFWVTLTGGLLLWAAYPPVGFSWLAWVAPLPWFWLILPKEMSGRRAYVQMWLGMTIPWLLMLEGVSRAHPANKFGCLALSLYLAAYLPAFVFCTRAAVHVSRVSAIVAAPIVWTALELARGYLLTGFSMALLGHAIAEWTLLIQCADVFGAYGVSFLIMSVVACCAVLFTTDTARTKIWPASAATIVIAGACAYGAFRIQTAPDNEGQRGLKVALLQGTKDKIFELNMEREQQTIQQYWALMQRARTESKDLDLIVWPEGTFSAAKNTDVLGDESSSPPPDMGLSETEFRDRFQRAQASFTNNVRQAAETAGRVWRDGEFQQAEVHLLLGAETSVFRTHSMSAYNSALHVSPKGEVIGRYYKMHLVMFGEYIPLGNVIPSLYQLTPMQQGLNRGDGPRSFDIKGWQISPDICFEITVPHLIRRQCNLLEHEMGAAPDLLVNVTDDGWFWGASILDYQLECAVFRAVEMRRPVLVAANTGISAWIDGNGRILERGPKRKEHIIFADVHRDGRWTLYRWWGDCPAIACLMIALWWGRKGLQRRSRYRM